MKNIITFINESYNNLDDFIFNLNKSYCEEINNIKLDGIKFNFKSSSDTSATYKFNDKTLYEKVYNILSKSAGKYGVHNSKQFINIDNLFKPDEPYTYTDYKDYIIDYADEDFYDVPFIIGYSSHDYIITVVLFNFSDPYYEMKDKPAWKGSYDENTSIKNAQDIYNKRWKPIIDTLKEINKLLKSNKTEYKVY